MAILPAIGQAHLLVNNKYIYLVYTRPSFRPNMLHFSFRSMLKAPIKFKILWGHVPRPSRGGRYKGLSSAYQVLWLTSTSRYATVYKGYSNVLTYNINWKWYKSFQCYHFLYILRKRCCKLQSIKPQIYVHPCGFF